MAFYQLVLRIYLKFVLECKQRLGFFFQSDAIIPLQTKRAQGGRETHDGILLLFLSDHLFLFLCTHSGSLSISALGQTHSSYIVLSGPASIKVPFSDVERARCSNTNIKWFLNAFIYSFYLF